MSEADSRAVATVSNRRYRWLDRATKLGGVALIAGGLEVGGDTTAGLALGILGVTIGLSTVVIDNE